MHVMFVLYPRDMAFGVVPKVQGKTTLGRLPLVRVALFQIASTSIQARRV